MEWVESRFRSVPVGLCRHLKFTERRVFSACLCMCSCGTVALPPQFAGDRPNFAWNTHDPPGSAADGAIPEVWSKCCQGNCYLQLPPLYSVLFLNSILICIAYFWSSLSGKFLPFCWKFSRVCLVRIKLWNIFSVKSDRNCLTFKIAKQEKMGVLCFFNGFSLIVPDVVFRVCKTIFPPIPRPPPKYLYFLEKNDGLNVSRRKNSHQCAFRSPYCAVEASVCVCLSRSIILAHQLRKRRSLWFYTIETLLSGSYPGKSEWKC